MQPAAVNERARAGALGYLHQTMGSATPRRCIGSVFALERGVHALVARLAAPQATAGSPEAALIPWRTGKAFRLRQS